MPHIDDGTLHALLDGALRAEAPGRADAVEAHLEACADCMARLEQAAALKDEASDVLASLDAGLEDPAGAAPDFDEVLARAAAGADDDTANPAAPADLDSDRARLRRRLGWTRGLAWAATVVVALGTGYIIRDMAGPTGEVPRAARPVVTDTVRPQTQSAEAAAVRTLNEAQEDVSDRAEAEASEAVAVERAAAEDAAPERVAAETEAVKAGPDSGAGAPAAPVEREALAEELRLRAERARTELAEAPSRAMQTVGVTPTSLADEAAPTQLRDDDVSMRTGTTVVGCYRLSVDAWSPPLTGESGSLAPPVRFELTDSVGTEGAEQGRLLLRPRIGDTDPELRSRRNAFWEPLAPDSVRLVWTDGKAELRLDMKVHGFTALEGRARMVTGPGAEGESVSRTSVRALRVNCPVEGG